MFKTNISDGVGSQNESIDTPLYPPLFWLDNIFNVKLHFRCEKINIQYEFFFTFYSHVKKITILTVFYGKEFKKC